MRGAPGRIYAGLGMNLEMRLPPLRPPAVLDAGLAVLLAVLSVLDGWQLLFPDPQTQQTYRIVINAPQVVAAAGSLETPALLLRSGIGGPAVGADLRLHPATLVAASMTNRSIRGSPRYGRDHERIRGSQ